MLFLTSECNLRCVYCHCNSGEQNRGKMSKEFAFYVVNKFIETIYKPYQSNEVLKITFMGGGEPFLQYSVIKDIVNYIDKLKIDAEYTIVTNGTIGNEKDWQWLVEKNFNITISADGPPLIQNAQRKYAKRNKSTSNVIEKNLYILSELGAKVNIRSTVINPANISLICEYFKQFPCVATHHLEPVSFAGRAASIKHFNELEFYSSFFKNYSFYLFEDPRRFKSSWFRPFKKSDGFCGATYFNAIVTHDGYISLCSEVDSSMLKYDYGQKYICGHITNDNPFESAKALEFAIKNSVYNLEMCKNCIIRYKCGGGCYIKRDRDFKDDSQFYNAYCKNSIVLVMLYLIGLYENKYEKNQIV